MSTPSLKAEENRSLSAIGHPWRGRKEQARLPKANPWELEKAAWFPELSSGSKPKPAPWLLHWSLPPGRGLAARSHPLPRDGALRPASQRGSRPSHCQQQHRSWTLRFLRQWHWPIAAPHRVCGSSLAAVLGCPLQWGAAGESQAQQWAWGGKVPLLQHSARKERWDAASCRDTSQQEQVMAKPMGAGWVLRGPPPGTSLHPLRRRWVTHLLLGLRWVCAGCGAQGFYTRGGVSGSSLRSGCGVGQGLIPEPGPEPAWGWETPPSRPQGWFQRQSRDGWGRAAPRGNSRRVPRGGGLRDSQQGQGLGAGCWEWRLGLGRWEMLLPPMLPKRMSADAVEVPRPPRPPRPPLLEMVLSSTPAPHPGHPLGLH